MDINSVVVRSADQVSGDLDGEMIILGIDRGKYYHLEEVERRIWEMLDHPMPVSELVDRLTAEFTVEPADCEAEVLSFLEELRAEGLAHVQPGDGAG